MSSATESQAPAESGRIRSREELRAIVPDANPATQLKIFDRLEEPAPEFIARSPFLLLATSDPEGRLDVSPKGDGPGFVTLEDEKTLLIPDRRGNNLAMGLENILDNPHVGVLFLVPGTGETLRVNGSAELRADPALLDRLAARGRPAQLVIRVSVEECFFHCPKAFLRADLWNADGWPEVQRVSFGRILAKRMGKGRDVADKIDAALEVSREDL